MPITLNDATLVGLSLLASKLDSWGGAGALPETASPEGLALLSYCIRYLPDEPAWFPGGKFRALQEVQAALDKYAEAKMAAFLKKEAFDHDDGE